MTVDLFGAPSTSRFPPPREFQDRAHRELRSGVMSGHQRQVLMAPTGAGKTYLALRLCEETLRRGKRVLFICDRKTLINQTSSVADSYGMPIHGIIQAANPRMALWRPFQIASAQTISARGLTDDFHVIVVDECHTLYSDVTELVTSTKAAVVGLSATPFTKGLGGIYSRVVNAATMDELVKLGVLTPLRIRTCVKPDMTDAPTTAGEWTAKSAAERGASIVGDVVLEWTQHANGVKTICFGSKIDHCEAIAERFNAAGIGARVFSANTKDDERKEILEEFRRPNSRIRVLVSVEALAKGFDVPDVACVIDCRPLRKSLSTWLQMVGRGVRSSPGKAECLLLDHSGNALRFARDFADVYFNGLAELDAGEKLDKEVREEPSEPSVCPACGYSPAAKRCVRCGFEAKSVSLVEHEAGRSVEVDILGTGPSAYAKSKRELFAMCRYHALAKSEQRVDQGRPAGNPEGAAANRYRELVGAWPAGTWKTDQPIRPSSALSGKIRSLEIAFAKSGGRNMLTRPKPTTGSGGRP